MTRLLVVDKPPTCAGEWLMPPGSQPDDLTAECWTGSHAGCTGYTEPESDPELCECQCHRDQEEQFFREMDQ